MLSVWGAKSLHSGTEYLAYFSQFSCFLRHTIKSVKYGDTGKQIKMLYLNRNAKSIDLTL